MDRYVDMFVCLNEQNEGVFVFFVMIGDLDLEILEKIIIQLIESGVDVLELGIFFFDLVVDGLIIQKVVICVLDNSVMLIKCFELFVCICVKYLDILVGLLFYSNLVLVKGVEYFYIEVVKVGVDLILIVDVLICEVKCFIDMVNSNGIKQILIVLFNVIDVIFQVIGDLFVGYIYLFGCVGVMGVEMVVIMLVVFLIEKLISVNVVLLLLGFGIFNLEQVKYVIESGVVGVILGLVIVNLIE